MSDRAGAKAVARGFARLLVLAPVGIYRLAALVHDPDRAFHGASQAMSAIPGLVGELLRHEFYRMTLESCGEDVCISYGVIFSKRGARLGRRVYLGTRCTVGLATIEDDVLLASNVDVVSGAGQHVFDDPERPIREQGGAFTRVVIGADSWIGTKCVVMADVGKGCVVGAGSVVAKEIPAGSIAVGAPARVVGRRGDARRPESGSA
jgi:acetyltransferase-like isoleucine patch superfamily enzyme